MKRDATSGGTSKDEELRPKTKMGLALAESRV